MKLIIAVVTQNEDAHNVIDALLEAEFRATRLASTGGFLRRGNTTVMIGVEDAQVDTVIDIIRRNTRSRAQSGEGGGAPVQIAGATVFVLDLEGYERL